MAVETFNISASGKASIPKDPNAVLDYSFDFTEWLAAASTPADTITNAQCTVTGSTNAGVDSVAYNGQVVTAWVSGGVVGETLALRCRVVTSGGRTDDRTVYLKIKER